GAAPPPGGMAPPGGMPPPGGDPSMGGMPPQGQQQPMMPPMAEPPPQPLPINPRPNPPSPKTSFQAQQEANMLGLLEAKQQPASGGEDIQCDLMATDTKLAACVQRLTKCADESADPNTGMRGWHWKALQHEEEKNQNDWLPRVFK